ncbi:type VI secretion system-associated FHA domain protein TagH [Pseudomonas sp. Marseille-QA0892]
MDLIFEIVGGIGVSGGAGHKRFGQRGGVIGRSAEADWTLPDNQRLISGRHAEITFEDGAFFLTDVSSNGVELKQEGLGLKKYERYRIRQGDIFCLGRTDIRASFEQATESRTNETVMPGGGMIPDDAFLGLDPMADLDPASSQTDPYLGMLDLPKDHRTERDHAPIHDEHMIVPELVEPALSTAPPSRPVGMSPIPPLRAGLSAALGVDLEKLDDEAITTIAIESATLLRYTIAQLQQSVRNRDELKAELQLASTDKPYRVNPLEGQAAMEDVMAALFDRHDANGVTARRTIANAFRGLQAHQVALAAAVRAAGKSTFESFAPDRLESLFEADQRKSRFRTDGHRWRAYRRWYMNHSGADTPVESTSVRDFAQAYDDQLRLVSTMTIDIQG